MPLNTCFPLPPNFLDLRLDGDSDTVALPQLSGWYTFLSLQVNVGYTRQPQTQEVGHHVGL